MSLFDPFRSLHSVSNKFDQSVKYNEKEAKNTENSAQHTVNAIGKKEWSLCYMDDIFEIMQIENVTFDRLFNTSIDSHIYFENNEPNRSRETFLLSL